MAGSWICKGSAFLFLILYGFVLIKPMVPYLDFLIRKAYIIENLCINKEEPEKHCNGKCHLEKQVEKEVKGSNEDPVPPPPRNDKEEVQEYLLTRMSEHQPLSKRDLASPMYFRNYFFQYVPFVFHPPICGIYALGTSDFS